LGLLIAVALGVLMPGVAQGAETPSRLYDCAPRDPNAESPPPQPKLPPEVAALLPEAIESDDFEPVCPAGEVPEPTGIRQAQKKAPPARAADAGPAMASRAWGGRRFVSNHGKHGKWSPAATASREKLSGYWYSWSIGEQSVAFSKGVNSLFVVQTNEQPYIPTGESELNSHSSGQLWAMKLANGCYSTAETGWSESIGQFGDYQPHLFVYVIDCSVGVGYPSNQNGGWNWVQSSAVTFPNQVVTHNDAFHVYGARMTGNNWWIYYDGQWVGYIPHSTWSSMFPNVLNVLEAGGEVMTVNEQTCADMGYAGLFGGNPGAAMFSNVWYEYNYNTQCANAYLSSYSNDPSYYATGNWSSPPNHGYAFRYGGPGWC
jgi:hypothetical protein